MATSDIADIINDQSLYQCHGACGLWKPASAFQLSSSGKVYKKCRVCARATKSAANKAAYAKAAFHIKWLAYYSDPTRRNLTGLHRDYDTGIRNRQLFHQLPESMRSFAKSRLDIIMARHMDKISGPNGKWYRAIYIANVVSLCRWLLAHPGKTVHDRYQELGRRTMASYRIKRIIGMRPKRPAENDNNDNADNRQYSSIPTIVNVSPTVDNS